MAAIKLPQQANLLVEAESLALPAGSPWQLLSDPNASSGALLTVAPTFPTQSGVPTAASPGHLALQLNVAAPGTYYLSLRGMATGRLNASDAVSVGLDGKDLTSGAGLGGFGHGDQWTTTPLPIVIPTAGAHTIDIWARDPGFALDSLYLSSSASVEPGQGQAASAAAFLDSLGVNTHLTWLGSRYSDIAAVKSALAYIGVTNVRDTLSTAWAGPLFDQLGDMGIRMDWLMSPTPDGVPQGQALTWDLQRIRSHAWMTRSIEGPNEVDFTPVTWNGLTGSAGANAFQRDLYTQAKADPLLARFPVLQYTLGDYASYPAQQDMSAYADYGNTHAYTGDSDPPGVDVRFATAAQETLNGADPVITTETGYGTSSAQTYGRVSELAQAKYIPMLLAEQYAQGIKATYLYQLFDPFPGADPTSGFFNYYGLFRTDGTAKPAATALHWMTTWLAGTGQAIAPGTLNYTLSGAPGSVDSLLLQKGDGSFILMLWNDVKSFNPDTGADIATAPANVQVNFQGLPASVVLRDTLTGTSTTLAAAQSLTVAVPDHVVMLQIKGVPGSTAPTLLAPPAAAPLPGPAPLATTLGTGPDTLILRVSQNYWKGSAQYAVSVDGVQIGGTQTVRAFHSDGASDTLTLHGDWNVGAHSVKLSFLNDAWGGGSSADRNLYLDGATYDGAAVAGLPTGNVGSAASFPVTDATPATPAPKSVTIGTGTDSLVLRISEDSWQGDAQYTVSVDGVQVGGTQTAAASRSAGQSDTVTVNGDWALGSHTVTLSFLNDAYGGSPTMDRNLYLDGATYDGVAVGGSALGMVGVNSFAVTDVAPAPAAVTLGSGSDSLVLKLSQDAWGENARYAVSVDGVQIGAAQSASAYHSAGQSDTVTVRGNWAVGPHTVSVAFLNANPGAAPGTQRHLYLDSASYDGAAVASPPTGGIASAASFQVTDVPPPPRTVTIGTGVDALVLRISQDSWQGDAQYAVSMDGVQLGDVQTAAAYHSTGAVDTVTFRGDWALGPHQVGLTFLNDASDGTAAGDRNLYLMGATYDGVALASGAPGKVTSASFGVTDVAPAPVVAAIGSGPDALVLRISQDAWQANAQYAVNVDGVQIGGTQTASAYHAVGQSDTLTVHGDWGIGTHAVSVAYLNDAYGGAPTRDRNLYLDGVSYDGRPVATYNGNIGTASFAVSDNGLWG